MRIPFVLALADGMARNIIGHVDAMEYIPSGTVDGRNFDSLKLSVGSTEYIFLVHRLANDVSLPWISAAASGLWDAFLLLPCDSTDYFRGPKLYRAMRRFILSERNRDGDGHWYVQGPWSISKIAQAYPGFAARNLSVLDTDGNSTGTLRSPVMIAGDPAPTVTATIDYFPDDNDCINDVEPDLIELLGGF